MQKINFFQSYHNSSSRNYLERMNQGKPKIMKIAKKYGYDYWDGSRNTGYGGYFFIPGYWNKMAKKIIKKFRLKEDSKILDIGCGKGYLLEAIVSIIPHIKIYGCDISTYAIKHAHENIKSHLFHHNAKNKLKFKTKYFDLVISLNCLHNLEYDDLKKSITEIIRISKKSYIVVESYRNEKELFNLQCWALTANTFFSEKSWKKFLKSLNYQGCYEFIFFK